MSELMPGEFLLQFCRVIGKGGQDVLTPPGWPLWRTTYHTTTSVWKMPPSWHWQATLEVIGSKRSYALKWCKPNNDGDDAVPMSPVNIIQYQPRGGAAMPLGRLQLVWHHTGHVSQT